MRVQFLLFVFGACLCLPNCGCESKIQPTPAGTLRADPDGVKPPGKEGTKTLPDPPSQAKP